MRHRFFLHRPISVTACSAATFLFLASPALARENKRAICTAALTAYRNAIAQEEQGHFRDARASFQACSEASVCSFAPKCKARYEKLAREMPTVVPVVTDENGQPVVDVQVTVDGQPLTSHLDGQALAVEVGLHQFTFATSKGVFATEQVLVIEGQHNREIAVRIGGPKARPAPSTMAAPETAPAAAVHGPVGTPGAEPQVATPDTASNEVKASAPSTHETTAGPARPHGVLPYVLGGAGVLGLGVATALTIWGREDNDALGQCSPRCPQSSVDHIRVLYTLADVSVGLGIAGLALGAYYYLHTPSPEPSPPARSALRFDWGPTRSGAFASVAGVF